MDQEKPTGALALLRIAMLSIHSSPIGPLGTRDTGGMSVYVREVSRMLGLIGHRVDIFTYGRAGKPVEVLYPNVRLIHLGHDQRRRIGKEGLAGCLPAVFEALERHRLLEDTRYDLIHSHYWLSGAVGAMARARWRIPHVVMFHTLGMVKNLTRSGEHEPDRRIAHERWLARTADRIIVPSARERDHVTTLYHGQSERIDVIPCGVDLSLFKPSDKDAARRGLGLRPDESVVLYVGRFAPLKGLDRLIAAAALLKPVVPGLRLLIVGGDGPDGESTRALQRMAAEAGLDGRVTFAGRVEQHRLPIYYNAADALAVASHYESFGLVLLEALACGTPVVSTPVGGAEAFLRNGFNGVVVAESDPEALAGGLKQILLQPANRRVPAERIRAAVSGYGWERIADGVNACYQALVKLGADRLSGSGPGMRDCVGCPLYEQAIPDGRHSFQA